MKNTIRHLRALPAILLLGILPGLTFAEDTGTVIVKGTTICKSKTPVIYGFKCSNPNDLTVIEGGKARLWTCEINIKFINFFLEPQTESSKGCTCPSSAKLAEPLTARDSTNNIIGGIDETSCMADCMALAKRGLVQTMRYYQGSQGTWGSEGAWYTPASCPAQGSGVIGQVSTNTAPIQ